MEGVEIDGRPIKIKIFKSWDTYRKEKDAQGSDMKRGGYGGGDDRYHGGNNY